MSKFFYKEDTGEEKPSIYPAYTDGKNFYQIFGGSSIQFYDKNLKKILRNTEIDGVVEAETVDEAAQKLGL